MAGKIKTRGAAMAMFRLDYLSCFLTVVATILVGRKMWTGLVVSGVNSLIVCVIGFHTSQYGFIPANVFCICVNAFNLRAWLKAQKDPSESTTDASSEVAAGCKRMSTFVNAATRRLVNSFRIRGEGTLGNSISPLAVKGVWPFAPTPLRASANIGAPRLAQFHSGKGGSPTNLNGTFQVSPAIRVISASDTTHPEPERYAAKAVGF
jgi:hypothetical protein